MTRGISMLFGGISRVRVSTTVDEDLLRSARELLVGSTDAALLDEALVASYRRVEIDASYRAYDNVPLDAPDEWGDLASFRGAAGRFQVDNATSSVSFSSGTL